MFKSKTNKILAFTCSNHIVGDLYFAIMYPLLPYIAITYELNYTQTGLIKTVFDLGAALTQLPAGIISDRISEFWLIGGANLWVGIGVILMSLATTNIMFLGMSFITGIGGGVQHPVGARFVSRGSDPKSLFTSIGILNFSGDLGKIIAPIIVALLVVSFGWQKCLLFVGVTGIILVLGSMVTNLSISKSSNNANNIQTPTSTNNSKLLTVIDAQFVVLMMAGFIDSMIRTATLTFIPFIFISKGMTTLRTTLIFTILYSGGAIGKFSSGWLSDRYNAFTIIFATKIVVSILLPIILITNIPIGTVLVFILGIGLNGTSSVLYGIVAKITNPETRGKAYGIYYTSTEVGVAIAPILFGFIADSYSLNSSMIGISIVSLLVIILSKNIAIK
ncbi:MAG: MFS transporter [Dehalococcoidia bacterium]|tara:strand:+ start:2241 stop:3410 length:1170 start_codon:yes stop_codon:yes gene_type:complete